MVDFWIGLSAGMVIVAVFCIWLAVTAVRLVKQASDRLMCKNLAEYRASLVPDVEPTPEPIEPTPVDELHQDDLITDEEMAILDADVQTGVTRYLNV